jgi:hypothetical protein
MDEYRRRLFACDTPCRAGKVQWRLENLIRYAPLAVGLKPSAIQGEARLRGLERNISSKTIFILSVPFESAGRLGVTLSAHERQQPGWDRQQPGQQQR